MPIETARWQELSPFLDEAFELDSDGRAAWVERLRRERPDLVPDVQLLLDRLSALDEQRFLQDDPALGLLDPPDTASHAGRVLGSYTLEAPLGRGGMSSVWLARRSDGHFEGTVAVKLLNLALLASRGEQFFRREGRMLAKLLHPNIARIIDAGVATGGQPYLVLEYVDGMSIDRYCDERRLSVEARIRLFLDVLAAVGHAHANLIVHRDIKPSNVYVTNDGVVKLLDFGIAKLLQDEETAGATPTRDGGRALTPQYAAPEQILGTPITVATDVYALGVLLYVLLSGRHPTGEKATPPHHYLHSLLEKEPRRLSDAATTPDASDPVTVDEGAAYRAVTLPKLKRILRGDLDNVVARALKKDAQERYASVGEFADDLRRYLRNEPVTAQRTSAWYRARKFVVRHRWPVAMGTVATVAVIATAALALFQAQRAASEARNAAVERDRALILSSRNEAVADFLSVLIGDAANSEKPITVKEMVERSEALISAEYANNPENRAAVLDMLAVYYKDNGEDARAETLLRNAVEAVRNSPHTDLRRKVTCDHAIMLSYLGKAPAATRILEGVIADPHSSSQRVAECLLYRAYIASSADDSVNALKFAKQSLARLREDPHRSPYVESHMLGTVAVGERMNGRNDLAGSYFQQALAQLARAGRDRGSASVSLRSNWAQVSIAAGDPARALKLEDEALALVAKRDPDRPPPLYVFANRGYALHALGRYRESIDVYSRCEEMGKKAGSPKVELYCVSGKAATFRELGDLSAAEAAYRQSMDVVRRSPPGRAALWDLGMVRANIALDRGRLQEARSELDAAVTASGMPAAKVYAFMSRAELNMREGKLAAAEADARQALSIGQTAQGGIPYSNRTGLASLMLGRVLAAQGKNESAHEAFQAAVTHLSRTVSEQHPMLKLARELAGARAENLP